MNHADMFAPLYRLRDIESLRISTWDRTGKNQDWVMIQPAETAVVLEETGTGCVRHLYWTYIYGQPSSREPDQ